MRLDQISREIERKRRRFEKMQFDRTVPEAGRRGSVQSDKKRVVILMYVPAKTCQECAGAIPESHD